MQGGDGSGWVKVWDLPTRVFHWSIVLLFGASWLSIELNWIELHILLGEVTLALLVFRLLWGAVGSDTARFRNFLASPVAAWRHLAHLPRREPDREVGHNPAGGWSVMVLLALLLVQAGTGLFSNDDVMTEAPLAHLAGKRLSDTLSVMHGWNFTLLQIAVGVHVLAILAYAVLKRQNLVRPMLTGRKYLPAEIPPPRIAPLWQALAVLAGGVLAVVLLLRVMGEGS